MYSRALDCHSLHSVWPLVAAIMSHTTARPPVRSASRGRSTTATASSHPHPQQQQQHLLHPAAQHGRAPPTHHVSMEHPATLASRPPHPSENQRLLAEHIARGNSHLPPPPAPAKSADGGKWGVLQPAVDHYYATLFLVVVIIVAVILALYFTGKFSSSSSSGNGSAGQGQATPEGGAGKSSSSASNGGGSPHISSSAAGTPSFSNNQYGGYLQYGGTGTESGTDGQYGGHLASYPPSSISTFDTCMAAQTNIVYSKTLADGGTQSGIIAIDLNAYAFQSSNGFTNNMQICSELCCATPGCTSAALSNAGETYDNYNFFGCTNLGQTSGGSSLFGSSYDQCCVLRTSQADAYTSDTDFSYSSVFYTTNTYTCVQGVGKVMPTISLHSGQCYRVCRIERSQPGTVRCMHQPVRHHHGLWRHFCRNRHVFLRGTTHYRRCCRVRRSILLCTFPGRDELKHRQWILVRAGAAEYSGAD